MKTPPKTSKKGSNSRVTFKGDQEYVIKFPSLKNDYRGELMEDDSIEES